MFLKALYEQQKTDKTNLNWILKKILNLDLNGAIRNLRRNLHLFLDNVASRTENKNLGLGKTVRIMWSLIGRKMAWYVHNISFTFVRQYFFSYLIFLFFEFFKVILWTKLAIFWPIWDFNCETVFPKF